MNEKDLLLADMKINPKKYRREEMYRIIYNGLLTEQDLVVNSKILTKRAYEHILRYPTLSDEHRELPVSTLENPKSEYGNTDVYFFGLPGSGRSCVLAGLMAQTGKLGFRFDPRGSGGGGDYAMDLRNYARCSMLPPSDGSYYIQIINCEIRDNSTHLKKISLIDMPGHSIVSKIVGKDPITLKDLGYGADDLLMNDNNKVLFFIIDPTARPIREYNGNYIFQSDILNCVSYLLFKNNALMKKVAAIHVILTKSDTLGDNVDRDVIQDVIKSKGYQAFIEDIKHICEQYGINRRTGFHVGVYPFSIGKFMPGDVYEFDDSDSLRILRVIQNNLFVPCPFCSSRYRKTFFGRLESKISEWLES